MSEDLELAGTFDNYSGIAVANLGTKTFESSATDNKNSVLKDGADLAIVKCKDHPCLKMINDAKKKVVFFPEIGRLKFFYHLPTSISRICMRICVFCFQKKHTRKQKNFH